jgi:hypothetical protein
MALGNEAAKNTWMISQVNRLFRGRSTPNLKGTEQLRRSHEFQIDPVQRVLG